MDLANFVIRDSPEGTVAALVNVTADSAYGGRAIRFTRTPPGGPVTSGSSTAAAGDDAGTLGAALEVSVGTLRASETVQVCFQARIR